MKNRLLPLLVVCLVSLFVFPPQVNSGATGEGLAYLPLAFYQLPPTPPPTPEDRLFCSTFTKAITIPDGSPEGITDTINMPDTGLIVDLDFYVDISHTWIGDLSVRLTHQETGKSILLIDRPGVPETQDGCSGDNITAILDDGASQEAAGKCSATAPSISGSFIPKEPLDGFRGENNAGNWAIQVIDHAGAETGKLRRWCLDITTASTLPTDPPSPPPPHLPSSASVDVSGVNQAMPLDCETRSAVDWAAFFGHYINETQFFNRLPSSDNPDQGFVGNVWGVWGQIPPDDYGVHAGPIADLLRKYGVEAYAHRYLHWREVKEEIASGRPVIVWITGAVGKGTPVYYTANSGDYTVVARYEHTVMVKGYTPDSVRIQDGSKDYWRSLDEFLDSWSVMRNMAILAHP